MSLPERSTLPSSVERFPDALAGASAGSETDSSIEHGTDQHARLRTLVDRQWQLHGPESAIRGLRLTRATEPSGVIRALYQTSFCLVLQGAKSTAAGDVSVSYHTGECLFASMNMPVVSCIQEASEQKPYLAFSLEIDPATISELLLAHAAEIAPVKSEGNSESAGRVKTVGPLTTAPVPQDLYDPLIRLLQLLDHPADLPVLEPLVRREICWRLLRSSLAATLRQIGLKDSDTARIGQVAAWLRSHYQQSIRVADLAEMASMSQASFHRHFKAITQLTPVQFQKQIRLQEARRLLFSEQEVAAVGYQVGYESPSQFNRDYRKLFGAPPGKDKAFLRSEVAIESGDS